MIVVPKVLGKRPLKNRSLSGPCCKNRILMVLEINFQKVPKNYFETHGFGSESWKKVFKIHVQFTDDPWKNTGSVFLALKVLKTIFFQKFIYIVNFPGGKIIQNSKFDGSWKYSLKIWDLMESSLKKSAFMIQIVLEQFL